MNQPKTDPRIQRTRKLIMDSFMELSNIKEFKEITITDIAAEAMINRATFYYHFEDIYDLLEKVLSEVLLVNLNCSNYPHNELTEEAITSIFVAITNFQKSLSNRCHRGYEDTIARIIREQLEIIFYQLLSPQQHSEKDEGLRIMAIILSSGMYGASVDWMRNSHKITPEEFIELAIPHLLPAHHIGSPDN
ncbi:MULTISPECIES: TetR/AcrR family transcriptional regulator [unclassified Sporosarcina]|uniref:TetR/AcrR family transcriptional regulator n=1 Tax=unclassified Sporosarcina TaxID=2647733 RepID=UPI000C1649FB|nr:MULTISPECIES: TetR/AcrR family transcriptional regulator [unclassified Sporosarcina]PID03500.1 TetR family transcriptional regulator [Sporosarcina sp. P2]PID23523.1 TetR family transcriptional regulator [Sporosarcina sp. P7]